MIHSKPSKLPRNPSLVVISLMAVSATLVKITCGDSERPPISFWELGRNCCKNVASCNMYLAINTGRRFGPGMSSKVSGDFRPFLLITMYGVVRGSNQRIDIGLLALHMILRSCRDGKEQHNS